MTIASTDGPPMRGASWGPDDTIVFGTGQPSGLWRVSASGGEPEALTTPETEQVNHAWPHVLPGGRAVLFTILAGGSVENAQIAVLDLDTGEQRVLVPGGSNPRYAATGHLVYGVGGTLRAVRFDLDRLEVTDPDPVPVIDGVVTQGSGAVDFDLALDGSLAYVSGESSAVGGQNVLVWVDRQGNEAPLDLPARPYIGPRVSPDGTRLVASIFDPENTDVWIAQVTRGTIAKLTTAPGFDFGGLWTLDGERVVFASPREGPAGLFWVAADGSGEVERLMTDDGVQNLLPYGWSPDGDILVFEYATADTGRGIGVLSMEGERAWEPLIDTEANEEAPAVLAQWAVDRVCLR